MPAGRVRRRMGAAGALLVLSAMSGCGFMTDLADPADPPVRAEDPAPVSVVPAVGTPAPDQPRVIASGQLRTTSGPGGGLLTVTVGKVQTGLFPPVPNVLDCPMDGPSLQYVPVDFALSSPGLAAHVEIDRGPATPADVAGVAVFAESADGSETYCDDAPPLPTWDKFWNQAGAATVTVYVVLDQAVTPATPQGRNAVFPTLQLRISDLRVFGDPAQERSLRIVDLTVGAVCADDPDAICVPLG